MDLFSTFRDLAAKQNVSYESILEAALNEALSSLDKQCTQIAELSVESDRIFSQFERLRRERAQALDVTSKEGLSCSEWLLRTGIAEAKVKRLRAVVEALRTSVEQRSAQLEARGKGGQHVGEYGELASMPASAVQRLRWYLREFDRALEEAP